MRFERTVEAVREFVSALGHRSTYDPRHNSYILFGFLWGLPVPFFALAIECWASGDAFHAGMLGEHPIHFFFLAHPLLFAIVFGAMGSVRASKDGEIRRLIGDLERHVRELADANERLQELDHLKAQFVANVTHELKTPLVSIRGYTESILEGRFGPTTEKQRDGLAVAVRNVDRLQSLIAEVLEFERIDAGELTLDRSDFDLVPLVQEILATFRPRMDQRRLVAELRLPAELPVHADRDKIGRVLLNLLSNAIKFSPDGGRFGIDARVEEGMVHLAVWDRGKGVPEGLQKHLFTRFWQATRGVYGKGEGTGLGLVITKGILDAHGSPIEVVSSEGAGTTVHFRLPIARNARPEPGAEPAAALREGGGES